MASENEKRETVADVVAIVRRAAQYYEGEAEKSEGLLRESFKLSAANYREIADRIEAAAKRDEERAVEHATRHTEAVARDNCRDCIHNPKGKNYEGGNAAAMREALEKIRVIAKTFMDATRMRHVTDSVRIDVGGIEELANAALAAPPRQCDVGTAEEQAQRFHDFCVGHSSGINGMCKPTCPCIDCFDKCQCLTKWAQTPYEAQEGGAK